MENIKSKNKYYLTRHEYYEKKTEFKKYNEENKNKMIEQHEEYYIRIKLLYHKNKTL